MLLRLIDSFSKYKIKTKLNFIFLLIFFLLVVCIALLIGFYSYNIITVDMENNLYALAHSKADHIETYFEQTIERFKLITSRTAMRRTLDNYNKLPNQDDVDNINNILTDAVVPVKDFERICIINLEGQVLASTNQSFIGLNLSDKNFFNEGKIKDGIYFVKEDEKYKLFISGPIKLDNKLIGVGITVVNLDYLKNIIYERTGLGNTGEIIIAFYNEDGKIVYPIERLFETEADSVLLDSSFVSEHMKYALSGIDKVFNNTLDYRNKKVVAVSAFVKTGGIGLIAKIDRDEAYFSFSGLFVFYIAIILIFLVIYLIISRYIIKIITSPIEKLQHDVEIIEQGNLDYNIDAQVKDEIGQLARAFNRMVQGIKKSRAEIDRKVKEQTQEILARQNDMDNQQKAILNILEDVEVEKDNVLIERDKIDAILHSIGDGVFVVDLDLKIEVFNEVAAEMSGYLATEAIGKKYDQILKFVFEKDGNTNDLFIKEAIKTGQIKEMANHTLLIKKDGTKIAVADSAAPLKDKDNKVFGCVVVFRDVTKEREIDKMKTEFVSLASHQLRTPLSAIKWFLEMVLGGDAGKINEEQKELLQQASESNERMINLVNGLLNVSRIESGRLTLEPKLTDLVKLSKTVISEVNPIIKAHNQKLNFLASKNIPKVNIDPKLISQVVANLLSNASKYTPARGKIDFNIQVQDKDIIFTVKDNGMGIPKSQQNKIFEKFFRADNVVSTDTEGTGLGLYVAKAVVEASGGNIGFNSTEKKGSTFWFRLPLSGSKGIKGEKSLEKIV